MEIVLAFSGFVLAVVGCIAASIVLFLVAVVLFALAFGAANWLYDRYFPAAWWRPWVMAAMLAIAPVALANAVLCPWNAPMVAHDFVMAGGLDAMTLRVMVGADQGDYLHDSESHKSLPDGEAREVAGGPVMLDAPHKFGGHPKATGSTGCS